MGKSTPSQPAAPDPNTTAKAQTQSNKETALYNFGLNNPNVISPLGSSTFVQSNTTPTYNMDAYNSALNAWKAAGSKTGAPIEDYRTWQNHQRGTANSTREKYDAYVAANQGNAGSMPTLEQFKTGEGGQPQVSQTIKLSPEQQQLYDLQTSQSIDLGKLATALQGRVGEALNTPNVNPADINALSKQAQDSYYKQQTQYLDPQWENSQKQQNASLANQGITMGSEAWQHAQDDLARQKQMAYSNAQMNAIAQGPQNAQQLFSLNSAERNQPLNEFNALRSQSQVSMPQFGGVNGVSAQPTNTAQITQNAYQNSLNAYNQQLAANNNMSSGLFSLGGSLGAAYLMSDVRLKTRIERIGETKGGVPVYRYKYKGADKLYIGVMAQDVPHAAIMTNSGFFAVDYSRVV